MWNWERLQVALSAALVAMAMLGCSDDSGDDTSDGGTGAGGGGAKVEPCDVVVSDDDCDTSLRPIVFVHGTYGSGDNIANVAMLFGSNGYCQDRFVAVEYNSLGGNPAAALDALIDDIRETTGQDKVDLMGHSQGTGHCVTYLTDAARAEKVAHYVNLSGQREVPNGVATLSISSNNDLNATTHHAPNAADKVTFEDHDHFGLASSNEAFAAIYEYLMGEAPKYTEIQCGDEEITVEGVAEQFGDNTPVTDGTIEVYEIDPDGDPYERGEPVLTLQSEAGDDTGHIPPFKLKRGVAYEFKALDAEGKLVGHQYFAPWKRSNRLARFLAPPESILVSTLTTDKVKRGPDHSALVFRSLAGAFRHDLGQSLQIDGKEILADDTAGRENCTVGLFAADQDENGKTDLGVSFEAPFVFGTDTFIDAKEPAWVEIDWNGDKIHIPNWPSSEGMISVTLK